MVQALVGEDRVVATRWMPVVEVARQRDQPAVETGFPRSAFNPGKRCRVDVDAVDDNAVSTW